MIVDDFDDLLKLIVEFGVEKLNGGCRISSLKLLLKSRPFESLRILHTSPTLNVHH